MPWTVDDVLSMAPDAASARAGRDLSSPARWLLLGRNDSALWGECRGSAARAYRTCAEPSGRAFTCSCPSRKSPCKHVLGLLLLLAGRPAAVPMASPPEWVGDWLEARARRAARAAGAPAGDPAERAEAAARRAEQRLARIGGGIDDLALWMSDLVSAGFRELPSRPAQYWEQPAARMVDAQAPGIARRVREMAALPYSGPGWPDRMLSRLGLLHLVLEGWRRLDGLPDDLRQEVLSEVGVAEPRESVLTSERRLAGDWLVLGRRTTLETDLRVRRTWLQHAATGRPALVLEFSHVSQRTPPDPTLAPGTAFRGELAFYAGTSALRALVAGVEGPVSDPGQPHLTGLADGLDGFARDLGRSPFLYSGPMALGGVLPLREDDGAWYVRDAEVAVPLATWSGWSLLALSGGHPIDVFGEWDGRRLDPIGAWAGDRFVNLDDVA